MIGAAHKPILYDYVLAAKPSLPFVAVGTPVARRPPQSSVRAGLLHTAPTSGNWRQPARSDADAGSWHLESIDQPTARTVPRSSCLAGSAAEALGTSAK